MRVRPRYFKIKTDVNIFFTKKYLIYKLTTYLLFDTLFFSPYLAISGGSGYFGNLNYYDNSRNLSVILFLANGDITPFLKKILTAAIRIQRKKRFILIKTRILTRART